MAITRTITGPANAGLNFADRLLTALGGTGVHSLSRFADALYSTCVAASFRYFSSIVQSSSTSSPWRVAVTILTTGGVLSMSSLYSGVSRAGSFGSRVPSLK